MEKKQPSHHITHFSKSIILKNEGGFFLGRLYCASGFESCGIISKDPENTTIFSRESPFYTTQKDLENAEQFFCNIKNLKLQNHFNTQEWIDTIQNFLEKLKESQK